MGKRFCIGGAGARWRGWLAAFVVAALLAGCSEPITTYQVPGACISQGKRILVLPFMDTRTFVDESDPHKDDLGEHARDIFVAAMREKGLCGDAEIVTPDMGKIEASLTSAQAADLGRAHNADTVVAGQIFSFTETRAASIPPRAGMFVRVVSSADGSLLFVGDHYQAAALPGAGGGRDLQARNVSLRLLEGLSAQGGVGVAARRRNSSTRAYASLAEIDRLPIAGNKSRAGEFDQIDEPVPEPPPFIGFAGGSAINPDEWDDQVVPEVPPILSFEEPAYIETTTYPAVVPVGEGETVTAGPGAESAEETESGAATRSERQTEAPATETAIPASAEEESAEPMAVAAVETEPMPEPPPPELQSDDELFADGAEAEQAFTDTAFDAEETADRIDDDADGEPEIPAELARDDAAMDEVLDASHAARMSGDELAADLFASEEALLEESLAMGRGQVIVPVAEPAAIVQAAPEAVVPDEAPAAAVAVAEEMPDIAAAAPAAAEVIEPAPVEAAPASDEFTYLSDADLSEARAFAFEDNGPVYSIPLAVEQPAAVMSNARGEPARSNGADVNGGTDIAPSSAADSGKVRVLVLPYHDRENPNNLILHTGGGEVVTTLYGAQLALDSGIRVMWDASAQTSHDRLVDADEAIKLGRMVNADFVVRGQVVEFRRAQSVPSFYSAVISTAVLAAQLFFAEMSGVDVATEVYRVSDGVCVMSRRDRAQQKYVVQAEKTVRKLAAGMATDVVKALKSTEPAVMDPLIDTLTPTILLSRID